MYPAWVAWGKEGRHSQVKNRNLALDWGNAIWACADLISNAYKRHVGQIWLTYGVSKAIDVSWIVVHFSESECVNSED